MKNNRFQKFPVIILLFGQFMREKRSLTENIHQSGHHNHVSNITNIILLFNRNLMLTWDLWRLGIFPWCCFCPGHRYWSIYRGKKDHNWEFWYFFTHIWAKLQISLLQDPILRICIHLGSECYGQIVPWPHKWGKLVSFWQKCE